MALDPGAPGVRGPTSEAAPQPNADAQPSAQDSHRLPSGLAAPQPIPPTPDPATCTEYRATPSDGATARKPKFKRLADPNPVFAAYQQDRLPPAASPPIDDDKLADLRRQEAEKWDEVERVRPQGATAPQSKVQSLQPEVADLTVAMALDELRQQGDWKQYEAKVPAEGTNFFWGMLGYSLKASLKEGRRFVMCLKHMPFDHTNPTHRRMMLTVYRRLTKERSVALSSGSHMESIGFQGHDPATDLRAAGLFAVVQLLSLVDRHSAISDRLFAVATSAHQEFPFALVGINLSCIALEALAGDRLVKQMNKQGSVVDVLNDFYCGLWLLFETLWTSAPTRRITEWDAVRRSLQQTARDQPQKMLDQLQKAAKTRTPAAPALPFAEF
jgi:hypothetical protein